VNDRAVACLYDNLHAFESRHRNGDAYPVHKKLQLEGPAQIDIYDWIIARLKLPDHGDVLDAGCGVGFGSLRLAQSSTCRVTGISLSADEIASANASAARLNLADRAQFVRRSFDDLPAAAYDLVIAVESLKHSGDLGSSLESVRRSLKPGGRLVIVEDLFCGEPRELAARELARDWGLERLHCEGDYIAALGAEHCAVIDLSDRVPRKRLSAARIKRALLELWLLVAPAAHAGALRAFRGGFWLETLYARGQMTYKAIFFQLDRAALP
jgi:SAM-dependent methyltransferase